MKLNQEWSCWLDIHGLLLIFGGILLSSVVQAQSLVRLAAGEGAKLFDDDHPQGVDVRLLSNDQLPSWMLPLTSFGLTFDRSLPKICCESVASTRCVSDRGVPLRGKKKYVLDRYGPPKTNTTSTLQYSGIIFLLDGDSKVEQMCVIRR